MRAMEDKIVPSEEALPSSLPSSALFAILVTYRRPVELSMTLERLTEQTRKPDRLIVVDNAPGDATKEAVTRVAERFPAVDYVPMSDNVGYTGGVRAGMELVLSTAAQEDWIVVCDDDDPPQSQEAFANLEQFARRMVAQEPDTGGVGLGGGRFDFKRGTIVRVPTHELKGPVALDYIGGNAFGCYRVAAIRDVGPWSADIFFGFSEGEFGLRLRKAGYLLWGEGDIWRTLRIAAGRADYVARPAKRLQPVGWRRYYSMRNVIWILRQHGRTGAAIRVSLFRGIGKPLANLPLTPLVAVRNLRLNARAIRDAWTDRMGRRVEPIPWGPRPKDNNVRTGLMRPRTP